MTAEAAASIALGVANTGCTLAAGRGHRAGWAGIAVLQCAWVPYDVATGQPGFLIITAFTLPACWAGLTGQPLLPARAARAGRRLACLAARAGRRSRL